MAFQGILFALCCIPFIAADIKYDNSRFHCLEELHRCKHILLITQHQVNLTEEVLELKNEVKALIAAQKRRELEIVVEKQLGECQESLLTAQHDALELSKCKANVTDYQAETNNLRQLVHERYTELDVVNAVIDGDLDILRLLLDAGMNAGSNDPAHYGNTALHNAARLGQLEMIRLLVEKGAALEARNTDNNTPFIDAAVGNSIPAAQLLIELGADPRARGWHGETARDRAVRDGKTAIANWLRDQGY